MPKASGKRNKSSVQDKLEPTAEPMKPRTQDIDKKIKVSDEEKLEADKIMLLWVEEEEKKLAKIIEEKRTEALKRQAQKLKGKPPVALKPLARKKDGEGNSGQWQPPLLTPKIEKS